MFRMDFNGFMKRLDKLLLTRKTISNLGALIGQSLALPPRCRKSVYCPHCNLGYPLGYPAHLIIFTSFLEGANGKPWKWFEKDKKQTRKIKVSVCQIPNGSVWFLRMRVERVTHVDLGQFGGWSWRFAASSATVLWCFFWQLQENACLASLAHTTKMDCFLEEHVLLQINPGWGYQLLQGGETHWAG